MKLLQTRTGQWVRIEREKNGFLIVAMGKERINNFNRIGYFGTKNKAEEFYNAYLKPEKK